MKIYIYKITNKINGKIYIGKHIDKSKNGIDDYMGSGIIIKNAQKKYGIENFTKDILEECTKEDVDQKEIFWIEKLQSTNYKIGYNVTKGGDGGDTFTNNPKAESLRKQFSEQIKGNKNPNFGHSTSEVPISVGIEAMLKNDLKANSIVLRGFQKEDEALIRKYVFLATGNDKIVCS